jgi:hypothetical protein
VSHLSYRDYLINKQPIEVPIPGTFDKVPKKRKLFSHLTMTRHFYGNESLPFGNWRIGTPHMPVCTKIYLF